MPSQLDSLKTKPSICLNMIVKNERHIIQRCFDSLKDYIDYWVISDTGSTDGTQAFIKDYFQQNNIDGELIENPWKDFAHNRNLALDAAKGKADYILFMDADDYMVWKDSLGFQDLTDDIYMLNLKHDTVLYGNIKLVRSNLKMKWRGVLHECLNFEGDYTISEYKADNCYITSTREGGRNQDPLKYQRDAEILERGLLEEPGNSRYQFYLARSYFDAEYYEKALENYQKRVAMGEWEEEVYYSLLEIANCYKALNYDSAVILNAYLKAHHYRPSRLEAIYEALLMCRLNNLHDLGYELARSVKIPKKLDDVLFLRHDIYAWKFLDELALCAMGARKFSEARGIIAHLIASPSTPSEQLERLHRNLNTALHR